MIDNDVHGCFVEAVRVGATLKSGHFLGRVCAQFSLHSLMRMRMGVGIGSGRYGARSGDILNYGTCNQYVCALLFFEVVCAIVVCALASFFSV